MMLGSDTAEKLAKICGLFGSDNDGERATAAAMAHKLVRSCGLEWSDLIKGIIWQRLPQSPAGKIRFAFANLDLLSRWEHGFLLSIRYKASKLTEKQLALLDQIVSKIAGVRA